jgi:MFS family permease
MLLPSAVTMFVTGMFAGRLAVRLGGKTLVTGGCLIGAAAMAVLASQTGVASGMSANIRTIGGSIGSAAMASIVTSRLASSGLPLESGYTTGFAIMTSALMLAAGAGLLIPATRRLRQHADAAGPGQAEPPQNWQRFLGMHLAGMRAAHPFGPSGL